MTRKARFDQWPPIAVANMSRTRKILDASLGATSKISFCVRCFMNGSGFSGASRVVLEF